MTQLVKMLDEQDWARHRAELATLMARLPGLFQDGDTQSAQTRLMSGTERAELQMQLNRLAQWHEQRSAMLQQAAIRMFLALNSRDAA